MTKKKNSAIGRAVKIAGSQSALARLMTTATGKPVPSQIICQWVALGYVPKAAAADLVSSLTGVPAADMLRRPARRQRSGKPLAASSPEPLER